MIKQRTIEVDTNEPFKNCKLNREKYAKVLTQIVSVHSDGFVMALNNNWGTGKTTFVKMWRQYLKNQGYKALYFNAWENDFDSNPLVALLSEFGKLKNKKNVVSFNSMLQKGEILFNRIPTSILKSLFDKNLFDSSEVIDTYKNVTKHSIDILSLKNEIKNFTSKKETIHDFRQALENFVNQPKNAKPLVFIIDELDRCRPNYSVELLEQIKHFFSVPGIVFVLSIDKQHLASAVKGFYGSGEINTDEYLRRFIDLEYSLPNPDAAVYCNHLYEFFQFNTFFRNDNRNQSEFGSDRRDTRVFSEFLFVSQNLTLRQIDRIYAHAYLSLKGFEVSKNVLPEMFLLLIYFRNHRQSFYEGIRNKKYKEQDLINEVGTLFSQSVTNYEIDKLLYGVANLIASYSEYLHNNRHNSWAYKNSNELKPDLSKFGFEGEDLIQSQERFIKWILDYKKIRPLGLSQYLDKLDLYDNFIT